MTCRLSQIVDRPEDLLEAFPFPVDAGAVDDWRPRYNIAPGGMTLIVHGEPDAAKATMMNWAQGVGRLRPWARDDTFIKGRYKSTKRCIIPVPGFYDWPSGTKKAYFVQPNDRKILTFAGIYVEHDEGGTFAVLTTEPNADIKPLHHRMAIYLEPKECELWLNPDTPAPKIHGLMKQWPEGRLKNYQVSTRVHNHKFDDAECIEPLASGKKKRGS
jgi:putative SOS response-associated peptidase YedK